MTKYTHVISEPTAYGTFSDYLDARNIYNCTLETGKVPAPVKNSEFKKIYKIKQICISSSCKNVFIKSR